MTCEQAMELISAMLDGELSPEENAALQAHLEACPDCKRLADSLRGLDAQLSGLREPAPQSLKRGVLYRIDQATGKAKKPRRWFGPGTAIGAVAAALVLLVGLGVIPLKAARSMDTFPAAAPEQADAVYNNEPVKTEAFSGVEHDASVSTIHRNQSISPDGSQLLPNDVKGSAESINEYPMPETEPAAPKEPREELPHRGVNMADTDSRPADEALWDGCAALSAEENAAVLLYTDFDAKSLFSLLETEQPELFALVENLEPRERDGMLLCETDCGTALAIQEWLLARLPRSESPDAADEKAETSLKARMEALDPGSKLLYRVITWDQLQRDTVWPKEWTEGWADRLRTGENWALFFPDEDFVPNTEKKAIIVFSYTEE